jgi:hypothetical protein
MCGFVDMMLVYCCVWFGGCVRVFLCVSNLEFLVEQWGQCGRGMAGAVNDLLLVMVFLIFVICCDGTSVK